MGIGYSTFKEWLNLFPALSAALKEGKAPVDIEVENALLKSALGHTVKLKKPVKVREKKQLKDKGTIEEERIEYAEEEVYVPPNVTAQIFWLRNRRPDKWRNNPPEGAADADETTADPLTAAIEAEIGRRAGGDDGAER